MNALETTITKIVSVRKVISSSKLGFRFVVEKSNGYGKPWKETLWGTKKNEYKKGDVSYE